MTAHDIWYQFCYPKDIQECEILTGTHIHQKPFVKQSSVKPMVSKNDYKLCLKDVIILQYPCIIKWNRRKITNSVVIKRVEIQAQIKDIVFDRSQFLEKMKKF